MSCVPWLLATYRFPTDRCAKAGSLARIHNRVNALIFRTKTKGEPAMGRLCGGCLCGAVRYVIDAAPDKRMQITCHCRDCQQVTGTGHARSMGVRGDAVAWTGAPRVFQIQHDNSVVDSAFCEICGSPLFKRTSNLPDMVFFHVGSLDPESGQDWRPKLTVFTERRQPWDELAPLGSDQ